MSYKISFTTSPLVARVLETVSSIGKKPGQQVIEEVANLLPERIEAGGSYFLGV